MASYNLIYSNLLISPTKSSFHEISHYYSKPTTEYGGKHGSTQRTFASKSGGFFSFGSVLKRCEICEGQGAVECSGCKGTGRNKKNGNIFERWKCFDCQGFGMKSCPSCGKGGLTPEQRGER